MANIGQFVLHLMHLILFPLHKAVIIMGGMGILMFPVMAQNAPQSLSEIPVASENPLPASDKADNMVPHDDVIALLVSHPRVMEARFAVCSAYFEGLGYRAQYFPKLDASVSIGRKLVNKTTRSDEYGGTDSPEYDGQGVGFNLGLRQLIYDWGVTKTSINITGMARDRALLGLHIVLEEQIVSILQITLDYIAQDTIFLHLQAAMEDIDEAMEIVEKRFRGGVGSILDVREAQIIQLEQQSELENAGRRRDQALDVLMTQFEIKKDLAINFIKKFLKKRPDIPELIASEMTWQARVFDYDIRSAESEIKLLNAQRLPKFDAVVFARFWDILDKEQCGTTINAFHPDYGKGRALAGETGFFAPRTLYSNCYSSEVTANVEFSMPLYDGGSSKAQQRTIVARERGLRASRIGYMREHSANSRYLQAQLSSYKQNLHDKHAQFSELGKQLDGLLILQGKTQFDPLIVLRLQGRHTSLATEIISLEFQIENLRIQALQSADNLARLLEVDIRMENSGC